MTIDEFAALTRKVIAGSSLAGYLPTAHYPERRLVAFRCGAAQFKVIRVTAKGREEAVFDA